MIAIGSVDVGFPWFSLIFVHSEFLNLHQSLSISVLRFRNMRCFRPATVQDMVQKLQVVREVLHVEFCSREYKTIRSISNAVSAYFWEGRRGEWGHQVTKKNIKNQTVLRFVCHSQETVAILHSLPSATSSKHSNVSRRWAYGSSCSSRSSCNSISVVPFLSKSKPKPFHFLKSHWIPLNHHKILLNHHFPILFIPFLQRWRQVSPKDGEDPGVSQAERNGLSSSRVCLSRNVEGLFEALGA